MAPIKCPGLFQISHPERDMLLFLGAVALEVWGLLMIFAAGIIPLENIIVVVFAAVALDVIFAIIHHTPTRFMCEAANEALAAKHFNPAQPSKHAQKCQTKITLLFWLVQAPAAALILAVAAIKIYAYYDVRGQFNIFTIAVMISYLVVAYIHIMHTGYALSAFVALASFKVDFYRFLRGASKVNVAGHRVAAINTTAILLENSLQVSENVELKKQQSSSKVADEKRSNAGANSVEGLRQPALTNPVLFSWGILTDPELESLVEFQPTDDGKELARYGVYHQLQILRATQAVANVGAPFERETFGLSEQWIKASRPGHYGDDDAEQEG